MATRAWKVYGITGHRQRESFNESYRFMVKRDNECVLVDVQNSDITGTNEYSLVSITASTRQMCLDELNGQISDGIFENSRVGRIEDYYDIVYAVQHGDNFDWDDCYDNRSEALDVANKMSSDPKYTLDEIRVIMIDNVDKVALSEEIIREGLR